ncbi:hypothetical protein V492_03426 [Pseudogymnoascus sp. VKM F-4246]|nr:hypothetical protein V492_03426 [Pseudogymnoascus sp. VKM F-4246]
MSSKQGSYPPLDLRVLKTQNTKRISYYYDEEVANYYYREDHPMEPQRIKMTHSLVTHTGIYKKLSILRAMPVSADEMKNFHAEEYVDFLERVTPETVLPPPGECFGLDTNDCPPFEGVFKFSAISAAGSLEGAAKLGLGNCDIAINWSGGLHHAMKSHASGFCYINDIVLAILELLRHHPRVLYIDIDVHHGDAVETAFLTTDRVMTASFHQYSPSTGFFPQTGSVGDVGRGKGRNFAVNFPLNKGIDDASYKGVFEPVIEEIMARFCPSVIVLQCGADSLNQDKLGGLNLSMRGHANCIEFVKRLSVPTLVLGGGGYTIRNVARTWAYETGVLVGTDLQPLDLPVYDEYYEYYAPDYQLDVCAATDKKNLNTVQTLEANKIRIFENLRSIAGPPSVEIQDVPRSSLAFWVDPEVEGARRDEDEDDYPDVRYTTYRRDRQVHRDEDLSDSYDEEGINDAYVMPIRRQNDSPRNSTRNYQSYGEEDVEDVEDAADRRAARPDYGSPALKSDTTGPGEREQTIWLEQHANKLSPTKSLTTVIKATNTARSPARAGKPQPRNPANDPRISRNDAARPEYRTQLSSSSDLTQSPLTSLSEVEFQKLTHDPDELKPYTTNRRLSKGTLSASKSRWNPRYVIAQVRAGKIKRKSCILFIFAPVTIILAIIIAVVTYFTVVAKKHHPNLNVDLGYTQYKGFRSDGIDKWFGMRYAAPPLGDLRFRAPKDPWRASKQNAFNQGKLCHATPSHHLDHATSEDCLFINVYSPTNRSALHPVYFFIQGGGFNALANPYLTGDNLIKAANNDIVVVTSNYRVGPWGFLASKEVKENGDLNVGLLDQRKALAWVQKYIHLFGGDPNHVTIDGDSAGAASVDLHLTAYGGRNDNLFHAAAGQSNSFGAQLTVSESQYQYDGLVNRTECHTAQDTLKCLRELDMEVIASNNMVMRTPGAKGAPLFAYSNVIDGPGGFTEDYTYNMYADGKFVKVPVIFGSVTNEGTLFTPPKTDNVTDMTNFLKDNFGKLTTDQLNHIVSLYPQDKIEYPGKGAWWRTAADAYGELRYNCPAHFMNQMFENHTDGSSNWHYLWDVVPPVHIKSGMGAMHAASMYSIFNITTGMAGELNPIIQAYWTSFIRTKNPNTHRLKGTPEWGNFGTAMEQLHFPIDPKNVSMVAVGAAEKARCHYYIRREQKQAELHSGEDPVGYNRMAVAEIPTQETFIPENRIPGLRIDHPPYPRRCDEGKYDRLHRQSPEAER